MNTSSLAYALSAALLLPIGVALPASATPSEEVTANVFYVDEQEKLQLEVVTVDDQKLDTELESISDTLQDEGNKVSEIIIEEPIELQTFADIRTHDDPFGEHWEDDYTAIGHTYANDYATGQGSVIAVVDTGVNDVPDLAGKLVSPFRNSGTTPDQDGHGTSVAVIAAAAKDGNYSQGLAYDASIMPVNISEVEDNQVVLNTQFAADGIIHAVNNGADIINMSFGGPMKSSVLRTALDYAAAHNVILIAASGNTGYGVLNTTSLWPASYSDVIGVANYDASLNMLNESSVWRGVDFTMPGTDILVNTDVAAYWTGTSMASPYLAALAALAREIDPDISQQDFCTLLQAHSGRTTKAADLGWGLPRVDEFVQALSQRESG